jgi:hypothetical protein
MIAAVCLALEDDDVRECRNLVSGSRAGDAAADDQYVRRSEGAGAQDVCACAMRMRAFMLRESWSWDGYIGAFLSTGELVQTLS